MTDIDNLLEKFNNYLSSLLDYDKSLQHKVIDSIKYSLFSGGKRIRPMLTILTYKEFSKEDDSLDTILPFAAAIEMIHTYSLIHDDLPAMDDDDFRRDKPTNHKVYTEGIAILAGDGLLNMSMEILLRHIENLEDKDELKRAIRAMKYIYSATGVNGMIGGQTIDIDFNLEDYTEDTCENMYKLKTGALIKASVVVGGILAGVEADNITKLAKFGENIGLAYQFEDDLLDEEKDPDSGEINMLFFKEKEELKNEIIDLTNSSYEALEGLDLKDNLLKSFVAKLINRSR
ncbi:polyprenyl synthetase family protein [uncultured Peptoniphilus sp.]|uniref:Farnesyl diphosphate synthase n=1 Tax=Peptoniphilus gorbachii TaxID=411567 RepID=A0A6N3C7S5_9FIRM|nr:polyprenyl synthetase family protein [uncultured Peptoniphilus sp.]MDU3010334.1 polyprenyl synthetase family protein [Peptoniphilus harei]MDU4045759.1 polyprenyl synthetase family protein [Peptoniphilus harei]MDU5570353.1 polyprenyl synthetase family protein [Peptoniphilus harei]MDU6783819.1 polyprenyl synthetase family protein [Peptoniphilus harei]